MRFFKKIDPRQALLLSNGQWFTFTPAGDYGIVATEDKYLIDQFTQAMKNQRGGLSEIDFKEYSDLKKNPYWFERPATEVISPRYLLELKRQYEEAVAVAGDLIQPVVEAFKNISQPTVVSDYRPKGVKR